MQIAVKNPYEVTCPDGTKDISNGIAMPCTGRLGGKSQAPQSFNNQQNQTYSTPKNNTKEPIYYILVTAGVLVAGYFAYKKFKK